MVKNKTEELIKRELAKRGLEYVGMKQKEESDWKPKPHFRYNPVSRSKYTPHVSKKQLTRSNRNVIN